MFMPALVSRDNCTYSCDYARTVFTIFLTLISLGRGVHTFDCFLAVIVSYNKIFYQSVGYRKLLYKVTFVINYIIMCKYNLCEKDS